MAFIVKKKINGNEYFYLNQNKRENGKVKTKTLAYLGKKRKEAEKKAKEILNKLEKENVNKNSKMDTPESIKTTLDKKNISVDEMATFCKRKGFVYQSGEIYGGLAGFWDFGPVGVEMKNNIKTVFKKKEK